MSRLLHNIHVMAKHTKFGRWLYEVPYMAYVKKCTQHAFERDGIKVMGLVDAAMREAGATYFLEGGTMLGAIREGGFLKHDSDIDVGCPPDGGSPSKIMAALLSKGFKFHRGECYENQLDLFSVSWGRITIDVYFWTKENDRMTLNLYRSSDPVNKWVGSNCFKITLPLVTETKRVKFETLQLPVPVNCDEVLTASYGNWRVPDRNFDYYAKHNPNRINDRPHSGRMLTLDEVMQFTKTNHLENA